MQFHEASIMVRELFAPLVQISQVRKHASSSIKAGGKSILEFFLLLISMHNAIYAQCGFVGVPQATSGSLRTLFRVTPDCFTVQAAVSQALGSHKSSAM